MVKGMRPQPNSRRKWKVEVCSVGCEQKQKREFSDTKFEIRKRVDVSTECFSLHQGEAFG